ncbi:MAG: Dihydropteroate synthase [Verrucomicrobiales bacterium]|nr:Dihydropteroate synthase [Verrucomicrobiales bacterium]
MTIFGAGFVSPQPGGREAIPCWGEASPSSEACHFIWYRGLAVSLDVSVQRTKKHGLLSGFVCVFPHTDPFSLNTSTLCSKIIITQFQSRRLFAAPLMRAGGFRGFRRDWNYYFDMLTLDYLASLFEGHSDALKVKVSPIRLGSRVLDFNARPAIMGVVNLSADSWYRESVALTAEAAIQRGMVLSAQGADIIYVGAESSLAHAARVQDLEQKSMLLPVLKALVAKGIAVSIETYHPEVTRACLETGAAVVNLTGRTDRDQIYRMVAEQGATIIICHVQGENVREVGDFDFGKDTTQMFYDYFARETEFATSLGVRNIVIDPGLGFYYKNLQDSSVRIQHQMKTFLNTFRLRKLGFPVCHALPHAFETFGEEVRTAESFFAVLAALGKTDLFRTHEVAKVKAVVDTMGLFG